MGREGGLVSHRLQATSAITLFNASGSYIIVKDSLPSWTPPILGGAPFVMDCWISDKSLQLSAGITAINYLLGTYMAPSSNK